MSEKTIPFSVRLSQKDAEYIASLEIPEAKTPSDKIRSIIKNSYSEHQSKNDYAYLLEKFSKIYHPLMCKVNQSESEDENYSEIINLSLNWLIEINAYLNSHFNSDDKNNLKQVEEKIVQRNFRFLDQILRLAICDEEPSLNKDIIKSNLKNITKVIYTINNNKN